MDTIIIGGGASGLACALKLKLNNPEGSVTILEQLPLPGKKILATGNGRCNLSNTHAEHFKDVLDFFGSLGLAVRTDEEGRVYPYSNQAATVLEILEENCRALGVQIISECRVLEVDKELCVTTEKGIFTADNIVIATGGKAQKALGSDGSGYEILKSLGHRITPLTPSLVQMTSSSKYPRLLKGNRVKCNVSIFLDGKAAGEEYGEVLFTDYGLSGIVIMNLSRLVSSNFANKSPKKCHAVLDLIPDMSEKQIIGYLKMFKNLKGILGSKLASIIEKQSGGDIEKTAKFAKNWQLIITGTKGFDFAQVTSGGADLTEFDGYESKKAKGIYACGEVLNRQFKCGGFNLNFAFYSGIETANQITGNKK